MDLYTIGHSTRPVEEFLTLLKAHDITRVIDVRTAPGSRRNPQFLKEELDVALREHGIAYAHCRALGGFRKPRTDSINAGWRNESFRGFADYMQTPEFEAALKRLLEVAAEQPTAIMCAEAVPWRCHRSLIADAAVAHGVAAHHITSATRCGRHTLTSFARLEGGRVSYPAEPAEGGEHLKG